VVVNNSFQLFVFKLKTWKSFNVSDYSPPNKYNLSWNPKKVISHLGEGSFSLPCKVDHYLDTKLKEWKSFKYPTPYAYPPMIYKMFPMTKLFE
jgi:hypothetical protein